MGWKDKWLRQDTGPVCGRHETRRVTCLPMVSSKQEGQRQADLAIVPCLGDLGMYVQYFPQVRFRRQVRDDRAVVQGRGRITASL